MVFHALDYPEIIALSQAGCIQVERKPAGTEQRSGHERRKDGHGGHGRHPIGRPKAVERIHQESAVAVWPGARYSRVTALTVNVGEVTVKLKLPWLSTFSASKYTLPLDIGSTTRATTCVVVQLTI